MTLKQEDVDLIMQVYESRNGFLNGMVHDLKQIHRYFSEEAIRKYCGSKGLPLRRLKETTQFFLRSLHEQDVRDLEIMVERVNAEMHPFVQTRDYIRKTIRILGLEIDSAEGEKEKPSKNNNDHRPKMYRFGKCGIKLRGIERERYEFDIDPNAR
jgi:hypothetical protein